MLRTQNSKRKWKLRNCAWAEFSSRNGRFIVLNPFTGEKVKVNLCLTLCDPMDYSPPGSSVHGIFQARVLEWVAIPFSRGSFWPTWVSCSVGRHLTVWATREVLFTGDWPLLNINWQVRYQLTSGILEKIKIKIFPIIFFGKSPPNVPCILVFKP